MAALGAALVHSVRGGDEEGAALLHEALALAEAGRDREVECKVCRELGFVAVQASRGVSAGRWLGRASALAADDEERAAVLGVRGKALSDRAHYEAAIALLGESVALARRCGDVRQAAWSLAISGRALLLRGQWPEAVEALDDSLALVAEDGWVAFQPFPEALRAEVALRQGDRDRAIALLDHAFALGCRIGDPCWEAIAARARGPRARGGGRARGGARVAARRRGPRRAGRRSLRLDARLLPGRARRRRDRRRGAGRAASAWPSWSGSPLAATCASSSCAPRCIVRGSAMPAAWSPPACSARRSTTRRCTPSWPPPSDHTRGHTARVVESSWMMTAGDRLPQLDASSLVDGERLEAEVKDMYRHVARGDDAELHFEVGRGLAERLGYPALLDAIPAEALASFAGVGHHLDLAALRPGEAVLDLGSGSGTDVFCAAVLVGDSGRVVGVDITDEQLDKAARLRDGTASRRSSWSRRGSRSSRSTTRASTP